jgi:hypothetical protein
MDGPESRIHGRALRSNSHLRSSLPVPVLGAARTLPFRAARRGAGNRDGCILIVPGGVRLIDLTRLDGLSDR